jgi:hypothetical protein
VPAFVAALKKQGVTLATPPLPYTSNGSPLGDPSSAQGEAPTVIGKLKGAGVTSVILFTDIAMTGALTKFATQQEYRPEWVMTGYGYQDISLPRTGYDQEQWSPVRHREPLPLVVSTNIADVARLVLGPNKATTDP